MGGEGGTAAGDTADTPKLPTPDWYHTSYLVEHRSEIIARTAVSARCAVYVGTVGRSGHLLTLAL